MEHSCVARDYRGDLQEQEILNKLGWSPASYRTSTHDGAREVPVLVLTATLGKLVPEEDLPPSDSITTLF